MASTINCPCTTAFNIFRFFRDVTKHEDHCRALLNNKKGIRDNIEGERIGCAINDRISFL